MAPPHFCFACGHCCPNPEGQPGVCKVRYNRDGILYVPWGYAGGMQCDLSKRSHSSTPIPAHWRTAVTSQALRDPKAVVSPLATTPQQLVQQALQQGAKVLVGSGHPSHCPNPQWPIPPANTTNRLSTPAGKLMFHVIGTMAEFERGP